MDKYYKGIIWTNHALDRLRQRGISQIDAWAAFIRPDQSRYAVSKGAWVYYRMLKNQKIEVVAKKNEKGQWVILSVWSRTGKSVSEKKESFFVKILKKIIKN